MSQINKADFHQKALQLCAYGKMCYERGWSPATSSNYSIRINQIACALTSSGKHKGRLQPEDILAVDMQGHAITTLNDKGKPSAETLLHTQLYQRDNKIGAVLHTHSPNAVLLSHLVQANHVRIEGWELLKALQGITTHNTSITIPIFDNTQNIAELAQQVDAHMAQNNIHGYLIRGHGIYTWGQDIDTCFRHLEALESLMQYELTLLNLR